MSKFKAEITQANALIKMGNTGKGGVFPLSNKERLKAVRAGVKRKLKATMDENKRKRKKK
jgi:hypothetical protein